MKLSVVVHKAYWYSRKNILCVHIFACFKGSHSVNALTHSRRPTFIKDCMSVLLHYITAASAPHRHHTSGAVPTRLLCHPPHSTRHTRLHTLAEPLLITERGVEKII